MACIVYINWIYDYCKDFQVHSFKNLTNVEMNISQLQAVVAVAFHGNFSKAALELNLSQPAVSHAIATLEEELGIPLFTRGRQGAVLTPGGEKIVHHARLALQHLELMQKEANRQKGLNGGQVRIASFRSVATHILPDILVEFRSCFPGINATIMECSNFIEIEQALRNGRADIGFTHLPTSADFEVWELLRDEFVVLLPPTAKIASQEITWEEIAVHPLILLPCLPCGISLHNHLRAHAPPMATNASIQEDSTIVSMVHRGLAVAILGRLAAEPIPKEVQVYRLPVPHERVIGAAILADALHTPAVFAFLDTLKKFIKILLSFS